MCRTKESIWLIQEVCDERRMVSRGVVGRGSEEAVVEERAFEDCMDEEIEGVPDEEDSQAAGGSGMEGAFGEEIGGIEEYDDGREGYYGRAIDVLHYRSCGEGVGYDRGVREVVVRKVKM